MTATPDELRLNLEDWHRAAQRALSPAAYAYYASGANDEVTLRANREAFERLELYYRVLRDVSKRSTEATVLGHRCSMPVAVAPTAFHQLAHPEGELATVEGTSTAGVVFTVSSMSNRRLEQIVETSRTPVWFQLYVYKDRSITGAMLDRVTAAGCQAVVFTVDAPVLGRREADLRQSIEWPKNFRLENLLPLDHPEAAQIGTGAELSRYFADLIDPSIAWRDLEWLVSRCSMPVLVKGIVHPDDARLAIEHGAEGVIVSNHGGRQLDTAPATIRALPAVAEAIQWRTTAGGNAPTILLDGGVRRGTDIVKAVALGADAVLVGRPVLWGLAAAGAEGVGQVLSLLRAEIDLALALSGCRSISEVSDDLITPAVRA